MDYNSEKLRVLLKNEMGGMKKKEFAQQLGIAQETLTRYMSEVNPQKPSRSSLDKISKRTNIPLQDLLNACGYKDTRWLGGLSMDERAKKNIEVLKEGIGKMTAGIRIYQSISDFMEEYIFHYSQENVRYNLSPKKEYYGERLKNAEYYCTVCICFEGALGECRTWFVLYFCETKGGQIVVLGHDLSGEALIEAGVIGKEAYDILYEQGEVPEDLPYYYEIKNTISAAERILRAIFGEDEEDGIEVPQTVIGFGFELNEKPSDFETFLKNHNMDKNDLDEYKEDEEDEPDYGFIVAQIMRKETDIPFEWCKGENCSCVLLPRGNEDYKINELKQIVYPYAKELGLHSYGECAVYVKNYLDEDAIFEI